MTPQAPVRGLRRADLLTDDPAGAAAFWSDLFGWVVLTPLGQELACWVGERQVATCRRPGPGERPGWHVVFGGARGEHGSLTGPARAVAGHDPGRVRHGPWAPAPRHGEPCWVELRVADGPDAQACDGFWAGELGWEVRAGGVDGSHEPRAVYWLEERAVTGRAAPGPWQAGHPGAGWMCFFAVTDLDVAARRCAELGGQVMGAPAEAALGRVCVVADPGGAVCTLVERPRGWGGALQVRDGSALGVR
ncbi:VOC family protein [Streptoalloteichus tenebrarius]|uniref:VOC family protein n=1 Tax=Streptoalloteichus tenebrarius (strain ATCC 17920 / DSM 40477 / JCM 4838 / CBS 697.72 / NBRC 16177 / NCIMB 11028 / NRRL B-12390 / A12253. 1 / ISP 5477) TaxID=1933 RepID=UPI0035EC58D5